MTFAESVYPLFHGRTLDFVSAQLQARGIQVSRVTLSRYRSGDRLPENEQVVRELAAILGADPEPLVLVWMIEHDPGRVLGMILAALSEAGGADDPRSLEELASRVKTLRRTAPSIHSVTVEVKVDGRTVTTTTSQVPSADI